MKPPPGLKLRLIAGSQAISTRRLLLFLSGILLLSVSALLFIPASLLTTAEQSVIGLDIAHPHIPDSIKDLNPFKPTSHTPPPPSTNSTGSSDSWFSSWKWLNPFSSNIAVGDEERSVLPPMPKRCPVYTFYDSDAKGDDADVEDQLLLAWRRAFWAQGFQPVVLGMGEAKEHGLYRVVRDTGNFHPDFERELMRWLAWSRMGTGVLVDYRVIPMAPYDDHTFTALRRCDFTYATRYENYGHRVFAGDKASIDAVLKYITSAKGDNGTVTIEGATKMANNLFHIDPLPKSFADYTSEAIKIKYPKLQFSDLPKLINAHLHENWIARFSSGISLLLPFPETLGALHYPAQVLAERLAACPVDNPEPESCPSNKQDCKPCKKGLKVTPSKTFTNKTGIFSLGTIPHPYTFIALTNPEINLSTDYEDKSIRFVRRRTQRDEWLRAVTIPVSVGSGPRVVTIKAATANPTSTTILSTSDAGFKDIEWTLGFTLPTEEELKLDLPKPDAQQVKVLDTTHKDAFSAKDGGKKKRLRRAVEAWNLGGTEVWKFGRAYVDRMEMERRKWSEAEKAFGRGVAKNE